MPDRPLAPSPTPPPELPAAVLRAALKRGPMVGRDAELGELERRLDAARAGEGGVALLAGEPGIGKTRLATEACALARQQGFRVLTGRCDEDGAAPYQPWVEALRQYLAAASPEQTEAVLPPVAAELVRLVPRLAEKVNGGPPIAAAGAAARQSLHEAMGEFFARLTASQGPVLLFLDDMHWADEGSLALLHALARRGKALPLLIVGTYRDLPPDLQRPLEQTLATLNRERLAERLLLRRLSAAGVGEMVMEALGSRLSAPGSSPDSGRPTAAPLCACSGTGSRERAADSLLAAFVSALCQETEGNPFFVEEVLKHLVEEGAIFRECGRWQIKPPEQLSVPQSIKVAIRRRVERLSAESREALTLAAVIGQQFDLDLLLRASDMAEERLVELVEEWREASLIEDQHEAREEMYRFHHALIREVLYQAVSRRRRVRLHERAGLALEAIYPHDPEEHLEELAHHFARARGEAGMEKGVHYCLRAGKRAWRLSAYEAAIEPLTTALELLDRLPLDEPHLRKRWDVARDLYGAHRELGAFERGVEVIQEYLARAERAGYPWCVAAAHWELHWALLWAHIGAGIRGTERADRLVREQMEETLRIAEAHGLADWRATVLTRMAECPRGEEAPRAEALLRQVLQTPEGVPRDTLRDAYAWLTCACAEQGKWNEVAATLRESIAFGEPGMPTGPRTGVFAFLAPMERGMIQAGKWAEFVAFCEAAQALYAGVPLALRQWYLEPAAPSEEFRQLLFRDDFDGPAPRPEWRWQDPTQASLCSLSERPGHLTLRRQRMVGGPHLFLEVEGDFALEAKLIGEWDEQNVGWRQSGLCAQLDALNAVALDKYAPHDILQGDIRLVARVGGVGDCFGRGQLEGDACYLRLERTGYCFKALCSADGVHWLTCGGVDLPAKGPMRAGVSVGLCLVVHYDYVQLLGRG